MIKFTLLLFLLLSVNIKERDCDSVKSGIFYFYPPDSSGPFQIIRKDSLHEEINLQTLDTSWKIKWSENCNANLHFIRTTGKIEDAEQAFLSAHLMVMHILKVSDEYYIFQGGLDSLNSKFTIIDTIWFNKK